MTQPPASPLGTDVALTQILVVADPARSRDFWVDVLGAELYREYGGTSVVLRFAAAWLLLVSGGAPTADKPTVTFAPPADADQVSHAMTLRVADCQAAYEALLHHGILEMSHEELRLGKSGAEWFKRLGVDTDAAARQRRIFCRPCMDWSERRHHLAGSLGAALLSRLHGLKWATRDKNSRVIRFTPRGQRAFQAVLTAGVAGVKREK